MNCECRSTCAEIDLSAIKFNFDGIRRRVGDRVKILPAVKANAYGHGVKEVCEICFDAGADGFCVATIGEGAQIREFGINVPVMVLGCCSPFAVPEILHWNLEPTICDLTLAQALSEKALEKGIKALVHIKVDTGMGRIGFCQSDAVEAISKISELPGLSIKGIFTHFPSADEEDRSFTISQINQMNQIRTELSDIGIEIPLMHASNSAGILAYPEADFDAVRPGIMLYGYYPSDSIEKSILLKEALTLKTNIVFLKETKSDTCISYNRTYKTCKKSLIATLPIGYADGYPRGLSNVGEVVVRGKRANVVGRVCMDQLMIDVTDIPGVCVGDEVILYGGGYDFLSLTYIAEKIGTISYELLCTLSQRVPRVYI